jgi:ABC-2 type transport system permease protein
MSALRIFGQGLRLGMADFARTWTWKSWLWGWMVRILTNAAMWVLLGKLLNSPEKLEYLLIGNGVMAGPQATAWAIGALQADRMDGTYPLQVVAPTSLLPALVGRTSIWMFNGLATVIMTFAVLALAFGLTLPLDVALPLLPALMLICLTSYGFMLFLGAVATRAPMVRNAVMGASLALIMALCGVAVPVSFWPEPVQAIAMVLPVTHGLEAVRLLFAHGPAQAVALELALEALVGAGWLTLALLSVDRMAAAGRRDGSIEFS